MLVVNNNDLLCEEIFMFYIIYCYFVEWIDCWIMYDGFIVIVCLILL